MYTICLYMLKKAVRLKDTNQKFRIKAIQSHLFYIKDQSKSFNEKCKKSNNPYGDGKASKKIIQSLRNIKLENIEFLKTSRSELIGFNILISL